MRSSRYLKHPCMLSCKSSISLWFCYINICYSFLWRFCMPRLQCLTIITPRSKSMQQLMRSWLIAMAPTRRITRMDSTQFITEVVQQHQWSYLGNMLVNSSQWRLDCTSLSRCASINVSTTWSWCSTWTQCRGSMSRRDISVSGKVSLEWISIATTMWIGSMQSTTKTRSVLVISHSLNQQPN